MPLTAAPSLRRAVTSPTGPSAASSQLATPPTGQPAVPRPMTLQEMESAMCRLASQHHMSEYNQMKRQQSIPFASTAYPARTLPLSSHTPTRPSPHPSNPQVPARTSPIVYKSPTTGSIIIKTRSQSTKPPSAPTPSRARNESDQADIEAAQILSLMNQPVHVETGSSTDESMQDPDASHTPRAIAKTLQSAGLSRSPPGSLDPPAVPKLHRSYTEEEGENPHPHPSTDCNSGTSIVATTSSLAELPVNANGVPEQGLNLLLSTDGAPDLSPTRSALAKTEGKDLEVDVDLSACLIDAMDSPMPVGVDIDVATPASVQVTPPVQQLKRPINPLPAHLQSSPALSRSGTSPSTTGSSTGAVARARQQATVVSYHTQVDPALAGVKTSVTHPMNVSPLIPAELLPLYGQTILHSSASPASSGEMNRSRSPLARLSSNVDANGELVPGRPASPSKHGSNGQRPASPAGAGQHGSSPDSDKENRMRKTSGNSDTGRPTIVKEKAASNATNPSSADRSRPFVLPPSADIHLLTGPNASSALFNLTLPVSQQLAMTSASDSDSAATSAPRTLGNLVLSSCPGKKVRLTETHLHLLGVPDICRPGPAGGPTAVDPRTGSIVAVSTISAAGRSPICRDIKLDLQRAMEAEDVRAVVCCLDDEEMRFLGADFREYSRVAQELGLEVIRLPMAEGFAPSSPSIVDGHLTHLITRYTLRGHNVLVHCRGGVGRAGLFSCCWMIKLGLLGPISGIHDPTGNSIQQEMSVVERVIEVIRKRRSAKAIETPQQVHFILQYVHWLSTAGRQISTKQVLEEMETFVTADGTPQEKEGAAT